MSAAFDPRIAGQRGHLAPQDPPLTDQTDLIVQSHQRSQAYGITAQSEPTTTARCAAI